MAGFGESPRCGQVLVQELKPPPADESGEKALALLKLPPPPPAGEMDCVPPTGLKPLLSGDPGIAWPPRLRPNGVSDETDATPPPPWAEAGESGRGG
ncbi:MAG: hypothetical protein GEU28_07680 [Dehalococcoidia bacterium]|nr:hypothetical protein [Dehalococcoidia bacterium]